MENKREKFIESAAKRVNNIIHDIEILKPMARSNLYDFTKDDVSQMFSAIEETINSVKSEFIRRLENSQKDSKKIFSFGVTHDENLEDMEEF